MLVIRNFDPSAVLTGKKKGGGDGFDLTVPVDGVVTNVNCNKGEQTHIELDFGNGRGAGSGTNQATCAGWLNANPGWVIMQYTWKKDSTKCDVEEPWPITTN